MATITLRLDDQVKDHLEAVARARGTNLSDLVRSIVGDFLAPELREEWRYEAHVPSTLTAVDRQQLALLHRILARVLPEDENESDGDRAYQLERAQVLESGFVQQYGQEFAGIEPELSAQDCEFVIKVLEMFRRITFSVQKLEREGVAIPEDLTHQLSFRGFDLNDSRESKLRDYALYLVNEDRWSELLPTFSDDNDRGNSHMPCAAMYARMLDVLDSMPFDDVSMRKARDRFFLDVEALQQVADGRVHPSRR